MFNLNILEQVCMEDSYSRDQTRSLVLKDMEDSIDEQIDQAVSDLFEYVNKTYSYESKNRRLTELVEKNFFDFLKFSRLVRIDFSLVQPTATEDRFIYIPFILLSLVASVKALLILYSPTPWLSAFDRMGSRTPTKLLSLYSVIS